MAHRMALDHPAALRRLAVLDIAPTATMYARTDKEFASRYFWWFFLIQPYPLPERLIAGEPEFFLRRHIDGQTSTPGATEPAAFAEYLRCYMDPATRHAICEDYRAAAGIDLVHDAEDSDRKVQAPLLALWGAQGLSASSTMSWKHGARRRSMSGERRSTAATPCRRSARTRCFPACGLSS